MALFRKIFGWMVFGIGVFFILTTIVSLFTDGFWDFIGNTVITFIVLFIGLIILPQSEIDKFDKVKEIKNTPEKDVSKSEKLTPKQLSDFYDLSLDILEDDVVSMQECYDLQAWFDANPAGDYDSHTILISTSLLLAFIDGKVDEDEKYELFTLLTEFCEDYEESLGERLPPQFDALIPVGLDDLEDGEAYGMIYRDSNGKKSNRTIVFRGVEERDNRQYLLGICTQKNAFRTFRVDRIESLTSLDTGEIFID